MLEIITPVFLLALMSSVHWVPEPPPIPGRGCGGPGVTEMLPFSGRLQEVYNLNHVAQIWYLVKCIYFGPSAYRIRCGYPNQILGNFLTKHFNLINLILFKG